MNATQPYGTWLDDTAKIAMYRRVIGFVRLAGKRDLTARERYLRNDAIREAQLLTGLQTSDMQMLIDALTRMLTDALDKRDNAHAD